MEYKNEIVRINEILEEKKVLFNKFEEVTEMLIDFDVDSSETLVRKRDKLINSMDKLNLEFKEICDNIPIGNEIRDAVNNKVDWSNCKKEYQTIFKSGQDLITIFSRIKRKGEIVVTNINAQKDNVLEQIKKQNSSGDAKTAKYYNSTQPMGVQNYKLLDSKL